MGHYLQDLDLDMREDHREKPAKPVPNKAPIDVLLDRVDWQPCSGVRPTSDSTPYATHEGILKISGGVLLCYILNTGQRVFDADSVAAFFGGLTE